MSTNRLVRIKVTNVEVIHKESQGSIIVKNPDGTTVSLLTGLNVAKGQHGQILCVGDEKLFILEP